MAWLLLAPSAVAATQVNRATAPAQIEALAKQAMQTTGARGLAIATIKDGQVRSVAAFGDRNASGEPLETDTIMYGASLTKAVFAYTVMELVRDGRVSLDQPIGELLGGSLPEDSETRDKYADYRPLNRDLRWRKLTPRILLTHSAGFANFGFLEPDGQLKIHFDPGSRYAYSGDGLILLQLALERGLGIDLGEEMQSRVFGPLGMNRTSMRWRDDFRGNLADGWTETGAVEPHDERSTVRAAGSMDTTVADFARFAAAFSRGERLGDEGLTEMIRPQLPITTASQFPTLQPEAEPPKRIPNLSAGLGVILFDGPQGPGFFKGGHNDSTGNMWVCMVDGRRCVVILANDVRAEAAFPSIVRGILGETGIPWTWEYGPQSWAK